MIRNLAEEFIENHKESLRQYLSNVLDNEWLETVTLSDFDYFFNTVYINYLQINNNPSCTEREEMYKSFVLGLKRGRYINDC